MGGRPSNVQLEPLEQRRLLAFTAGVVEGVLQIDGSSADDTIRLWRSGSTLYVNSGPSSNIDANTHGFELETFNSIAINAGNGNDTVTLDQFGSQFTDSKSVTIDAGAGRDLVESIRDVNQSLTGSTTTAGLGFSMAGSPLSAVGLSGVEEGNLTGGASANLLDASGFSGNVSLWGFGDNDTLFGGSGNDGLRGGVGDDQMAGNDGNDALDASIGTDLADGGAGTDVIEVSRNADITLTDTTLVVGSELSTLVSFERTSIDGGTSANLINISAFSGAGLNFVNGMGGSDTLIGSNGDDVLRGNDGDDALLPGSGNNTLWGGNGIDSAIINATESDDAATIDTSTVIINASVNDYAELEDLTVDGGAGFDFIDVARSGSGLTLLNFEFVTSQVLAVDDSYTTDIDVPFVDNVLANDTGTNLTATLLVGASSGELVFLPDGTFSYTPNAGFVGTDMFVYEISDGTNSAMATATIEVLGAISTVPVAVDDEVTTIEGTPVNIDVLANDIGQPGEQLFAGPLSLPLNGLLDINIDGTFSYTPNPGFTGTDSFDYYVLGLDGASEPATVTITVLPGQTNTAPTASPASVTTAEDAGFDLDLRTLASDADASDELTFTVSGATGGSVELLADGYTARFTPAGNYSGAAGFSFAVSDGTESASADVAVTVSPVADTPTVTVSPASGNVGDAIPLNIAASLGDTDGSEALSIQISGVPADVLLSAGSNNGNGTWTLSPADLAGLTLVGQSDATFTLAVTAITTESGNGDAASSSADLTVDVEGVVAPVVTVSGPSVATPGESVTIDLAVTNAVTGATFTYLVDWGDGTTETVTGGAAINASHVYTSLGNKSVHVVATDADGTPSEPAGLSLLVLPAHVKTTPAGQQLVIGGSEAAERITLRHGSVIVEISENGTPLFSETFTQDVDSIVVYGMGGDDVIDVDPNLTLPTTLFGGDGNDTLLGGGGDDLLDGGAGDDRFAPGLGSNTLMGGGGTNLYTPTGGDDVATGSNIQFVPWLGKLSGDASPTPVGTTRNFSADVVDLDAADTVTATFDWGDGTTTTSTLSSGMGTVTGSHAYASAGVYTVTLTLVDSAGNTTTDSFGYAVVYDPSGGFVTGGGAYNSPAGSLVSDPSESGLTTFGFVSRYKKDATTPDGDTLLQFWAGGFFFSSTDYNWLVVNEDSFQYQGVGKVNGWSGYGFVLSGVDGDKSGGDGTDEIRMQVYRLSDNEVIYDTQMGDAFDATPTTGILGQIMVHKSKQRSGQSTPPSVFSEITFESSSDTSFFSEEEEEDLPLL